MAGESDNGRLAYNAKAAAAALSLSKSGFHRLVSSGAIPAGFKLGGKTLWSESPRSSRHCSAKRNGNPETKMAAAR